MALTSPTPAGEPATKRPRTDASAATSTAAAAPQLPRTSTAAGDIRLQVLTGHLGALMDNAAISDCVIVVDGTDYPCIRGVLAQGSSFFNARFFGADKPTSDGKRVVVEEVTTAGWLAVRLWLYTVSKTPVSTAADVEGIILAAEHLGVPDLTASAVDDAVSLLSTDNAVALSNLSWSGRAGLEALQAASFFLLRSNFEAMRGRVDLCTDLSLPVFRALVDSPSLSVADEDALLAAVWRRLSSAVHGKDDVVALLRGIRLRQLGEASMAALAKVAEGSPTVAVPAPYPALREGTLACVLRGLPQLGKGPADDCHALPA